MNSPSEDRDTVPILIVDRSGVVDRKIIRRWDHHLGVRIPRWDIAMIVGQAARRQVVPVARDRK